MRKSTLLLSMLLTGSTQADTLTTLKLAVYLPQSPPYMFIDLNTGEVTGILPDIMKKFALQNNIEFAYQYLNRVRAEKELYSGKSDVSLLAPSWVEQPEKLIFSEPLYHNGDQFYATKPIPDSLEFSGQVVCTREFFKYPIFDKMVAEKKIVRMDTNSEANQLRMLLSGRCGFAYLNEWVANYMIKHEFDFATFYQANSNFDTSSGILAFHPRWYGKLPEFNQFVRQIKQSGELTEIVERYIK